MPRKQADPKESQRDSELLQLLAQQSAVLTSLATVLTSQQSSASGSSPLQPLPAVKSIQLPKLNSPDDITIPAFHDWKQRWTDYFKANQLHAQPVETQHGVLRSALHQDWTMLWSSGRIKIAPSTPIVDAIGLIEGYLRTKRNPLLDRQAFIRRDQQTGESIDRYYASLLELDNACSHDVDLQCTKCHELCESTCPQCNETLDIAAQLQQMRIRDRLICGLQDKEMQRRILAEQYSSVLTLDKVLNLCEAMEGSKVTGANLNANCGAVPDTLAVSKRQSSYKRQQRPSTSATVPAGLCPGCGQLANHERPDCPAYRSQCQNCNSFGHYTSVCRRQRPQFQGARPMINSPPTQHHLQPQQQPPLPQPRPPAQHQPGPPRQNNTLVISSLGQNKLVEIPTWINKQCFFVNWLADTGSDIDAISETDFLSLGGQALPALCNSTIDVVAANGQGLGGIGSVAMTLSLNGRLYNCTAGVFRNVTNPLLSKAGCRALGLIDEGWPFSRLQIAHHQSRAITSTSASPMGIENPDIQVHGVKESLLVKFGLTFDDENFRAVSGPPMSVQLLPGAVPCKRYHAYSVPLHWRDSVKQQLDTMEGKGVIEKVPIGEALEWCHPMVVVPKKGSTEPRITVDLTGLNKYVCGPAYPTKVPREEIASVPPNMRYFTTLDARWGYWQVPLDEPSKKLTSFITPWGSYRFRRNVMGLVSAGDEHNRRGDEALKGITNVKKVVEDILIYDCDFDTHVQRVAAVLQKCMENGITLNAKKFKFAQPEVEWCGFVINQHGFTPAPHLIDALTNFPVPQNKTDVRSFCGLVQQFESFSHRIAELSLPLRSLLSASTEFLWEATHQQAFEALIKELSSPKVLTQFDPGRPLRLETDAAQSKGLGFALYQQGRDEKWRFLQLGSRFVDETESRYSASEVELLAVIWAVHKCRMLLLGGSFELIVDHRPLIPIINSKTLDQIESPRLRRLKEKLAPFQVHAIWRAGTKHTVVDVLSRHPVALPTSDDFQMETDEYAPALLASLSTAGVATDIILEGIKSAADQCTEYQRLLFHVQHGFPAKERLDSDLQPYWTNRFELTSEEGLIFLGCRVLVPKVMRRSVLCTLHPSHQGQERTLRRARMSVYWPGITNDIRNVVQACRECANLLPSHQQEPLRQDPPPTYPFQEVATDIFTHAGYDFLVMVDRYSGWLNVAKCGRSATTGRVIHLLKSWMIDVGIPEKLISDNGPQFSSYEFKNWTKNWHIGHTTSSPHYPQSNGLAEAAVKAAKYLVIKTAPTGNLEEDAFLEGLMELRNTPRADGHSPAQLVFGSPTRTRLPIHRERFAEAWKERSQFHDDRAKSLREKATEQYNRRSHPLEMLRKGDIVLIQDYRTKRWDLVAQILEGHHRGRSYLLRTESGGVLRRNRRFLRPLTAHRENDLTVGENVMNPPVRSDEDEEREPSSGSLRRSTRERRTPDRLTYAQILKRGSNFEGGHEVRRVSIPQSKWRDTRGTSTGQSTADTTHSSDYIQC